jgi:hypothetical protein
VWVTLADNANKEMEVLRMAIQSIMTIKVKDTLRKKSAELAREISELRELAPSDLKEIKQLETEMEKINDLLLRARARMDTIESVELARVLDNLHQKRMAIGKTRTDRKGVLQCEVEQLTRRIRENYVGGLQNVLAQLKGELSLEEVSKLGYRTKGGRNADYDVAYFRVKHNLKGISEFSDKVIAAMNFIRTEHFLSVDELEQKYFSVVNALPEKFEFIEEEISQQTLADLRSYVDEAQTTMATRDNSQVMMVSEAKEKADWYGLKQKGQWLKDDLFKI